MRSFDIGQEVSYTTDKEDILKYEFGMHGASLQLAGKTGKVVTYDDDLIGVDFGKNMEGLHSLGGTLKARTGLWVIPELLCPLKINLKSYEDMM